MYNIIFKKEKLDIKNFRAQMTEANKTELGSDFIKLEEATDIKKRCISAVIITLIIFMLYILIGYMIIRKRTFDFETDITFALVFISVFAFVCIVYPFIHELIHALAFPRKCEKYIWKLSTVAYLTDCSAVIGRQRFLFMLFAPLLFCGIIPFLLLILFGGYINGMLFISIYFSLFYVIYSCWSDVSAIYVIMKYVPKNAEVCLYGSEVYYRE